MALSAIPTLLFAQGGITSAMLRQFKADNALTANTKVLRNALAQNNINDLALVADNPDANDTYFSHEVKSKGITNQRSSGRCWLFTGLNVMRADAINRFQMGSFQFSQSYNFFYDQLEKSNLFLQAVIDNAKQPIDNQLNTWLFDHPLSDGGTFSGVQDVVTKYGVVPADVFPESFNANNTSKMSELIQLRLREDGLGEEPRGEGRQHSRRRRRARFGFIVQDVDAWGRQGGRERDRPGCQPRIAPRSQRIRGPGRKVQEEGRGARGSQARLPR